MNVIFYINKSDNNVIKKNIKKLKTLNVDLKMPCTVEKPVLKISDITLDGNIANFNYFYISDFGRYYYVDTKILQSGGVIEVSGNVDVLMSNADDILNLYAYVDRQENKHSAWITDELFPVENKRSISYIKLNAQPFSNVNQTYTLCVNGG